MTANPDDLTQILDIPSQEMVFIKAFNRHEVRYLIIGGTAVRFHGYLRHTSDLDVLIDNTRQNSHRVYDALASIVGSQPFTVDDLCKPKKKLTPCYYHFDILTSLDGMGFNKAWNEKITVEVAETPIHIISRQNLIDSKKIAPRQKDLDDIQALEDNKAGALFTQ